ncbi:MAG: hypothetical protein FDZ75_03140 [Actinobacteria bacterium]|nr:MAG: hypothetical protein FDZ75_03140 [Actinomycetota bacterium]
MWRPANVSQKARESWTGPERRSGRDRRVKRRFRFIDRRGGFDRRKRYPVFGTLRDSRWALIALLVLLNLMSLVDGVLTAAELWLGIANEGNPVLAHLARANPMLAAGFKVAVIALVSAGIWHSRRYRPVLALALIALVIYAVVLAYHWGNLSGLGWL